MRDKFFTNEFAEDTWNRKYRHGDESLDDWFKRVSGGNKQVEDLIRQKKFMFGGRVLANRGIASEDNKVTYSNCYVLEPPKDNIESIFDTAKELARTYSYGGGVGVNISNLRPKGSRVRNSAKSTTGATSFMDLYSMVTGLIAQKGRRGALMICMDARHPDIEEFIDIKKDLSKVNFANISVMVDDDFMIDAAEKNFTETNYIVYDENGKIIDKIPYSIDYNSLLYKLAKNNWGYAEPGMLFWDRIQKHNLLTAYEEFEYAGTNPCVIGDTLVQTVEGNIPIKDLVGTQPYVYCMDSDGKLIIQQATKVWKTRENAQLVKIDFLRGSIICTPDHKIYTRNRGWVEAKDLQPKDKLNGLCRRMKDEIHCAVKLSSQKNFTAEHRFILGHFEDITGKDVHHIDDNSLHNVLSNLEAIPHHVHSVMSNKGHENWNERNEKGQFVKVKEDFTKRESLTVNNHNKGLNYIVQSVELLDYTEDVYDMEVPVHHNFVANDIVIHNCGELPLPAYGSCNLGSMNLSAYVLNPFTEKAEFDFESFKKDVETCVVALNEVLIEGRDLHPLEKQKQVIDDYRQIGLGVTGLADMFIKMNVVYGSVISIDLCAQIWDILLNESIKASAMFKVVNSLDSFKGFSFEKFAQSDMLYLLDRDTINIVKQYGMYNSQLLTVPPAGSISILLDCSSGIEPNFMWHYKRKVESLYPEPKKIDCTAGIIREFDKIKPGEKLPESFVTAHDVNYRDRVKVQGKIQEFVDGSISSTVNLPNEATIEDVYDLYMYAWKMGLKGITVYRDNCEREGVLTTKDTEKKETVNTPIIQADVNVPVQLQRGEKKPIADDTIYYKREVKIGCGELNLFIGWSEKENALQDYWVKRKGKGGCECNIETTVISLSLIQRLGASYDLVREGFMGVSDCNAFTRARAKGRQLSKGTNCGTAIFNTIEAFEKEMMEKPDDAIDIFANMPTITPEAFKNINMSPVEKSEKEVAEDYQRSKCPDCGAFLRREGGCYTCPECGFNKCE